MAGFFLSELIFLIDLAFYKLHSQSQTYSTNSHFFYLSHLYD